MIFHSKEKCCSQSEEKMAGRKISKGVCAYCKLETTGAGMLKHLPGCTTRRERLAKSDSKKGTVEQLFHLRVQSAQDKNF
jgi:hypothetical protein